LVNEEGFELFPDLSNFFLGKRLPRAGTVGDVSNPTQSVLGTG